MTDNAHLALYRQFRPQRFAEVVGQMAPVAVLTNSLRRNSIGHAYLFVGPRGCGKTSCARLLAKALNCRQPVDGDCCGVCDACQDVAAGRSFDVIEVDAASNATVANIRELLAGVALATPGRRKVYILDEVHMLSQAASAALLKTLEEPPANVVFALATTDPAKVPAPVRSRCGILEFRLVDPDTMRAHLAAVAASAGLVVGDDVLDEAVRRGGGSIRDALSALESLAIGGMPPTSGTARDVAKAVVGTDSGAALSAIAQAVSTGIDPVRLAEMTIAELRDWFLIQMGTPHLAAQPATDDLVALARSTTARRTVQAMEVLGEALVTMGRSGDPRVALEVAAARCCRCADATVPELARRLTAVEAALSQ